MTPDAGDDWVNTLELFAWEHGLTPRETDDLTPGVILDYIQARHRAEQRRAVMLYSHADLSRRISGKLPDIWDVFPLWTREEINAARLEQLKRKMYRIAGR